MLIKGMSLQASVEGGIDGPKHATVVFTCEYVVGTQRELAEIVAMWNDGKPKEGFWDAIDYGYVDGNWPRFGPRTPEVTQEMCDAYVKAWEAEAERQRVVNCYQHGMGDCPMHDDPAAKNRAGVQAVLEIVAKESR